jgi:hypothetical protein
MKFIFYQQFEPKMSSYNYRPLFYDECLNGEFWTEIIVDKFLHLYQITNHLKNLKMLSEEELIINVSYD